MSNQPEPTSRADAIKQGQSLAAENAKVDEANRVTSEEPVAAPKEPIKKEEDTSANSDMKRDKLEEMAVAAGIENAADKEAFPNKDALVEAINNS